MEELYRQDSKQHKLSLSNRNALVLHGVTDVISFDLGEVLLETTVGMLTVKGQDLHVNKLNLDKGELDISGKVDGLAYSELTNYSQKAGSFIQRLFQ